MAWSDVTLYTNADLCSYFPKFADDYPGDVEGETSLYAHDRVKEMIKDNILLRLPELGNDIDTLEDFSFFKVPALFKNILIGLKEGYQMSDEDTQLLIEDNQAEYERNFEEAVAYYKKYLSPRGGLSATR